MSADAQGAWLVKLLRVLTFKIFQALQMTELESLQKSDRSSKHKRSIYRDLKKVKFCLINSMQIVQNKTGT